MSRRRFLRTTGGAATAVTLVPAHVLGAAGSVPPNSRLNLAFVGVGSQGLRVLLEFLKHPDVQGVAGREPCRRIVDAYNAKRSGNSQYRGCAAYTDYRELLEKDFDAIVVGTADVLHAPVAVAAMKKGKHVFGQKPMAHSLHAARRMAEVARETGVATQVAVGTQATEETRRLCEWIAAGAVGKVREVIEWLEACKGGKNRPGATFEFSATVTEALLLGNLAVGTGERLHWDSAAMKLTGSPTAQALVRPPSRPGWEL